MCTVAGHEASRDLTACDTAGNCTTVNIVPSTAVGKSLTATATLQGRTDNSITHTVDFYPPGDSFNPTLTVSPTASVLGTFQLGNLPNGTYTKTVKAPGYLQTVRSVTLSAGSVVDVDFGEQKAGDANGDNAVNILDLSILAGAYNTSVGDGSFAPSADFNGDGDVNILDLSLLAGNYNTAGEAP